MSLLSGPALAAGAALSADLPVLAGAVAGLGAFAVGAYDDATVDDSPKGFGGHLGALRRGRLTSGVVKVAGIGGCGLVATALLGDRGRDLLIGGAVVAASANLLNLLDLRPGRALKVAGAAGLALGQSGPVGAAAALLPGDLGERTMLGDAGANALGAVLGLALVHRHPHRRSASLAFLVAATALSERVSYSRVIEAVAPLRWADQVGRRP